MLRIEWYRKWGQVSRNLRIARGVRQPRNVSYEKSDSAKIFFTRFPIENQANVKIPRARVRQTRTRSGRYRNVIFDK